MVGRPKSKPAPKAQPSRANNWVENLPRPLKRNRNEDENCPQSEECAEGDDEAENPKGKPMSKKRKTMGKKKTSKKGKGDGDSTSKSASRKNGKSEKGIFFLCVY